MNFKNVLVLSILLVIMSSCGSSDTEQSGDEIDFSTIPIFQPEVIIDITEFGDDEFFGQIWNILPSNEDLIFVADGSQQKFFKFDVSGSYLGYIGGEGDGPGEYRQMGYSVILPPDTLAVMDWRNNMITFSSPVNGVWEPVKFLDTPRPPIDYGGDIFYFGMFHPLENGYLGVYRSSFTPVDTTTYSHEYYSLFDFDLTKLSEEPVLPAVSYRALVSRAENSVSMRSVNMLPRRYRLITSQNNVVDIWSQNSYAIIYSLDGSEVNRFQFHSERVPYSDSDKQEIVTEVIPDPSDSMFRRSEFINILPDVKNFVHDARIDDEDNIWLKVNPYHDDDPQWLVYSLTGDLIGAVDHIPGQIFKIQKGRIFVNMESERDIPSLTVFGF